MITNTEKNAKHPGWIMGVNPEAIEQQEKKGQNQLINSSELPVNINDEDKKILQDQGVKFGSPLAKDPIFCIAELPKGWSKRATDHSMWSELIDQDGNYKASIFYKAAFYDRSAFMRINKES
jgi:hypothetical protein